MTTPPSGGPPDGSPVVATLSPPRPTAALLARGHAACGAPGNARRRHHHPRPQGDRGYDATLADLFDLEGRALGGLLDEMVDHVADLAPRDTAVVVDLGCGSGSAPLRLAAAFPGAQVVALDRSAVMLDRVVARARTAGLRRRVHALAADLDEGWPDIPAPDVVWASSTLYELADPEQLLAGLRDTMRPGSLLVVTEPVGPPRFLPGDGFEDRVAAALLAGGWSASPDWSRPLEDVGLAVVARRSFTVADGGAGRPDLVGRFARAWFTRVRNRVGDALSAADLLGLDRLLAAHGPQSLLHRADLVLRAGRVAWVARAVA